MSDNSISVQVTRPWALVTGASAGIGREFCRQLAAQGYRLVLVARRQAELQILADQLNTEHGTECKVITMDLSRPDACELIVKQLEAELIDIEYLVNNAGYGIPGNFHIPDWRQHADFLQVMLTAVCELTRKLLPGMQQRGRGFIVNVASVAGLISATGGHTLYGPCKSFLIQFSECLALENTAHGVNVCALCPGFTYTEFHDVNGTRDMVSKLPSHMWLDARDVVRTTLENLSRDRPKAVLVPGLTYKFIVFASRYLPWLERILSNRAAKKFRVTE